MATKENIEWYIRWKIYLFRQDASYAFRSPKSYMFVFMGFFWLGVITGNFLLEVASFPFFVYYFLYLDYSRGVPKEWKRRQIVQKWQKEESKNGNKTV